MEYYSPFLFLHPLIVLEIACKQLLSTWIRWQNCPKIWLKVWKSPFDNPELQSTGIQRANRGEHVYPRKTISLTGAINLLNRSIRRMYVLRRVRWSGLPCAMVITLYYWSEKLRCRRWISHQSRSIATVTPLFARLIPIEKTVVDSKMLQIVTTSVHSAWPWNAGSATLRKGPNKAISMIRHCRKVLGTENKPMKRA